MRASMGWTAVVLVCAVALAFGGCGKKKKKKRATQVVEQPVKKDNGPNSCDLRATKKLCLEYTGANSSADEVAENCAGWDDTVFIKGTCPPGGLAACVQNLGPSHINMIFYEGADLATEAQACQENGNTWRTLGAKPAK